MNQQEKYNTIMDKYKNLDESIIPSEEDQKNFEQWKSKELKKQLTAILYSLFILLLVVVLIIFSDSIETFKDKLTSIMVCLIFVLVEYIIIKKYIQSRNWKMEYCNYGIVINKYQNLSKKKSKHSIDYYVIVLIGDKNINIKCPLSEYRKLEINDEVIIFAVDNKYLYLIKK